MGNIYPSFHLIIIILFFPLMVHALFIHKKLDRQDTVFVVMLCQLKTSYLNVVSEIEA